MAKRYENRGSISVAMKNNKKNSLEVSMNNSKMNEDLKMYDSL
jgi:hypothetical protein